MNLWRSTKKTRTPSDLLEESSGWENRFEIGNKWRMESASQSIQFLIRLGSYQTIALVDESGYAGHSQ